MNHPPVITVLDRVLEHATFRNLAYLSGSYVLLQSLLFSYKLVRNIFSPLRYLAGPRNDSFIFGNSKLVFGGPVGVTHEAWAEKYGHTYAYHGILFSHSLFTTDTRALSFVLAQSDSFPKPGVVRRNFGNNLGKGLLYAEFDVHRRQRRLMVSLVDVLYHGDLMIPQNPSFGPPQVRALVPVFWNKSNELKDIWLDMVREGPAVIDVLPWLARATLDIIGVAGFDYHFNSLKNEDEDELSRAFAKVFSSGQQMTPWTFLIGLIPGMRLLPNSRTSRIQANKKIMNRIGRRLVEEKKAALVEEQKTGSAAQGRDLLTLLIKSNMAYENENQRMSDEEVLAQIATFLVAGHETTATATTWALYALTKHPECQKKLRRELLDSGLGDEPSMAELDRLPYLDNVVRETMRVHPAVTSTMREVTHDVQIPVSKSFKDRNGVEQTSIGVQKGDTVFIPILVMNRNKEIWGEDAEVFRPERWDNLPENVKDMPSVWDHLMSFISGPHACIGFRFAIIEMKALLYSLIRAVEFEIDPKIVIEAQASIVTRPRIASEPEKGNQMPLICKPVLAI
ncbi:hypothetical protein FRC12_004666 [Ceratobasidium sp. 428]|nr:hypothetical protein FRC12_004666 [Ceratobasidium sp. 428]